jgi:hypothetical protein
MTIALIVLGILALVGLVATGRVMARDGYRAVPRRSAAHLDPEARFVAH